VRGSMLEPRTRRWIPGPGFEPQLSAPETDLH
jgi:hypothetical protein